ncbi:ATP-binding cassette domain-containing protein [Candidatus Methanomassiliicoccus intestinalis]|uniref:ATP-binding cassette domain-containing protein n=1 Tax=Candidatus Methanomassiliicoccus intestinalis TaxID=1406512 RepID=UPI0037DDB598
MTVGDGHSEDMIMIKNLMKKFRNFVTVNDLNLTVREGEIFGFLGPNGADKTTTVCMLSTLTNFDAGEATVDGHDILKEPLNAKEG